MAEIIDQADLEYQDGRSDKVYHVRIVKNDDGTYSVPFEFGRRGTTLNTGEKVSAGKATQARMLFEKIVSEKTRKGYRPMHGAPMHVAPAVTADAVKTAAAAAGADTGILPQLLNEVAEEALDALLDDPAWMLQEKMDGHRMMMRISTKTGVIGINRLGRTVRLPQPVVGAAEVLLGQLLLDGELVVDVYHAFDILEDGQENLRVLSAAERHARLVKRCAHLEDAIKVVPTFVDARVKRVMLKRITQQLGEGIVLKRIDAAYEPGRPNSGGSQLKFKLYATATVKVADGRDGKRSVAIMGRRGLVGAVGEDVPLGNVTIPANATVPAVGQFVEVRYLYAYPGGSLYQPTYLGPRSDKFEADAIETLKYKAEVAEAA